MVENKDKVFLEAVDRFMEVYFIDRESAEKIVNKLRVIQDNPVIISGKINESIRDNLEYITYEASPARVIGLIKLVENAKIYANERTGLNPEDEEYDHKREPLNLLDGLDPRLKILNYDLEKEEFSQDITAKTFKPYFKHANRNGINSDDEFVDDVLNVLKSGLESSLKDIKDPMDISRCKKWFFDFSDYISHINPQKVMSREYYNLGLLKDIKSCVKLGVKPINVYQRIVKEGLLDSREHQVKLLATWLDNFYVENYDGAVKLAEFREEKHLDTLRKLKESNSPDFLIKLEQETLDCQRYIKGILDKERESIVNYLGR